MIKGGPRLILASASPRRRRLLAEAGYAFEVVVPAVAELHGTEYTLREVTCGNALRKGLAVARRHSDASVLAADTLVALEGRLIGKPADRAAATRLLRLLSGRTHQVATGVFIVHFRRRRSLLFSVLSQVVFKKLSDRMIQDYLTTINPRDKAGGYAAQGPGRAIIARIIGSTSNVIGLPLEKTRPALARFGLRRAARA
ncbi:Maf family protein [soil metagenome]